MTVLPFPTERDRIRVECRRLFETHACLTRAIEDSRHADISRLRHMYEAHVASLAAYGLTEAAAFRLGAATRTTEKLP